MSYLRTFLPWIVYAVIPSSDWKWAALAGLIVSVVVISRQLRTGHPVDALIIEISSAVFFAAITAVAFADPNSGVHAYSAPLSSGFLAVVAGISLAAGRPFTLGIAKQTTPREYWDRPEFVRVNVIITGVWTAAFAATAIVLAAMAHAGQAHSTAAIIVQVAGFVVPMVFTVRYVAYVQAKAQALAQAQAQARVR
jgi:hypothetical protein